MGHDFTAAGLETGLPLKVVFPKRNQNGSRKN